MLGSGLGEFADDLEDARRLYTKDIPGYPRSTVEGHAGAIVAGTMAGKRLICFQGRVHVYEGYPVETVVFPVDVAAALGAEILILTNAAGGIQRHLRPGSLMLIEDHLDLQFRVKVRQSSEHSSLPPLTPAGVRRGGKGGRGGSESPYSRRLLEIAEAVALQARIPLKRGVLGVLTGPSYETPAEVAMLERLGADAAGMSTAPEAVEGARLGMEVLGLSCITNRAAGLSGKRLNHAEVIGTANRVKGQFKALLKEIIKSI